MNTVQARSPLTFTASAAWRRRRLSQGRVLGQSDFDQRDALSYLIDGHHHRSLGARGVADEGISYRNTAHQRQRIDRPLARLDWWVRWSRRIR